jgi:hypothetical protein
MDIIVFTTDGGDITTKSYPFELHIEDLEYLPRKSELIRKGDKMWLVNNIVYDYDDRNILIWVQEQV